MKTWKQGMRIATSAAAVAFLFVISTAVLEAQEVPGTEPQASQGAPGASATTDSASVKDPGKKGYWELGAFLGLLNDEPEYHPDDMADQYRRDALIGARGGYVLPIGLFVEAQGSNSLVRVSMPGPIWDHARNVNTFFIESFLGYNVTISPRFDAFLGGGAGVAILNPDGFPSESDFAMNYGVGGRYKFANSRLAVRGDVRMHQVFGVLQDTRVELGDMAPGEDLFALELSVGVSVFLGR